MKVLIVVPPLVGHINPTIALGRALLARGHEVTWCGYATLLAERVPEGGALWALSHGMDDRALAEVKARGLGLRGAAAFKFLWEDLFFPLSRAMLPGVREALAAVAPGVVVHDQQAFAGALAARLEGVPFVTSAATSAQLADPFDALPQLRSWLEDGLCELQRGAGLDASAQGVLSPAGILAWSTRALVGPEAALPPQTVLVGPAIGARREAPFPWERLDGRPLVFVSLGTVSGEVGQRFFQVVAAAFRAMPELQGVLVAPPDVVEAPANLICSPFVPQLELLARAAACVCHAGHNTVVEALAQGLPLVVAPVRDDQPVVAAQVVQAGAGVRVKFGRVNADKLVESIRTVLSDPGHREAARRIADSFAEAGGPVRAAEVVEQVARG